MTRENSSPPECLCVRLGGKPARQLNSRRTYELLTAHTDTDTETHTHKVTVRQAHADKHDNL